ncbi:MAG: helicase-related protein, partial [Myxococcota bacterium]
MVITGATGSGKSTEVPRWCPRPVVVVEPRRVACRALAARVAELEGVEVGAEVGYAVRDDRRAAEDTGILFVTPGVALRSLARLSARSAAFVLDEVHERTLETDLLLALLRGPDTRDRLVAMSATIDGEGFAQRLGATHLHAEGRSFPVEIDHVESGPTVPTSDRLAERVARAIERGEGDTLAFLPGKAEIARAHAALRSVDAEVMELHAQVRPEDQMRVFRPASRRKVVLSTNVAETSVTVPGIRLVIDSGLARQVRYVQGRGTLVLAPIARDAAEQRAGRAGRTGPGRCLRLWQRHAHLEATTPPELHRVSLVPLVLAAAAHGRHPEELEWLDPPKAHAVDEAREELQRLDALDAAGAITERGRALFRLPLDPWLGRLLVEAEGTALIDDMIDLAAVLSVGRSVFRGPLQEEEDPREDGCDLTAGLLALRGRGGPAADRGALAEARTHRKRLRSLFGRKGAEPGGRSEIPRQALLDLVLRADPRAARVRRTRGRHSYWAGEGSEMELDRHSAVSLRASRPEEKEPEAIVVLGLRSFREGHGADPWSGETVGVEGGQSYARGQRDGQTQTRAFS